jgi:hypothetical protein
MRNSPPPVPPTPPPAPPPVTEDYEEYEHDPYDPHAYSSNMVDPLTQQMQDVRRPTLNTPGPCLCRLFSSIRTTIKAKVPTIAQNTTNRWMQHLPSTSLRSPHSLGNRYVDVSALLAYHSHLLYS